MKHKLYRRGGLVAVMALNREYEAVTSSGVSLRALSSRLSPPENLDANILCNGSCRRIWNSMLMTGQGSDSATCSAVRASLRRSGHVVSRARDRALHKPFCYILSSFSWPSFFF